MNRDNHLIFEAFQNNRGVKVHISDSIEDKQEGTSEAGYFPFTTTVKQFDAKHIARALIKHAYGKYDQDRVEAALQSVLDSMEVNPYGEKKGIIELRIDEFPTDGMDHYVEARVVGKEENAEEYKQNRIVGNYIEDNGVRIGAFVGDSYSSKLTLHGKDMFMPGAPYADTVNYGTHIGLWYLNKRHRLIVKDASKWDEFKAETVAADDDKYFDGKRSHKHDHLGDKIAAKDAYWQKKIAAGADQSSAEDAEGISLKKGDSVYFNDPDYPSYKNIVFQIRDLHGEDANLWSNELPSSGKPFWVKIKNLKKAR